MDGGVLRAALAPAITVPQGLVGYWPLDLGSLNWGANKAYDRSGKGNDGTLNNLTSAALVPGRIRQALVFNGSTQFIDTNKSTIVDAAQAITLAAWIYIVAAGSYPGIITKCVAWSEGNAKYLLELHSNARTPKLVIGGVLSSAGSAIPLNTWTHLAAVNSAAGYVIYINGRSNVSGAALAAPTTSADTWRIGSFITTGSSGFFSGRIDDARIYNRALSAQEILSIYTAGLSGRA